MECFLPKTWDRYGVRTVRCFRQDFEVKLIWFIHYGLEDELKIMKMYYCDLAIKLRVTQTIKLKSYEELVEDHMNSIEAVFTEEVYQVMQII